MNHPVHCTINKSHETAVASCNFMILNLEYPGMVIVFKKKNHSTNVIKDYFFNSNSLILLVQ